jgi:hypothetical protein
LEQAQVEAYADVHVKPRCNRRCFFAPHQRKTPQTSHLCKLLHDPVDLLRLPGEPKLPQQRAQRGVDGGAAVALAVDPGVHDRDG